MSLSESMKIFDVETETYDKTIHRIAIAMDRFYYNNYSIVKDVKVND